MAIKIRQVKTNVAKGERKLKSFVTFLGGVVCFAISHAAFAISAGDAAKNVNGSFDGISLAVQGFFALAGLCMCGLSIFTFYKHNKTDGQQGKLSTAAILLIGGGALFYIASVITTSGDTVWGTGGGDKTRVTIQR
ncbi:hypothetical protein HBO23_32085 [Pseudomonas sp. WS 5532]|uniref:hypothetical protein n=1 Tax=Pseudomonas sp. WS 5532 TaxID=2717495 RepID=UPI0014756E07|nr:hypothetical protein [Pseudomonas sp. WS 5532]NMX77608.1 hypothetical protein [Pseudomonas sp. WS 5532]